MNASQQIEQLKTDLEHQLEQVKYSGQQLLDYHPRYEAQAKEMIQIAKAKQAQCKEDMFELSFSSEFQVGKSTTVNAVADGREVCP